LAGHIVGSKLDWLFSHSSPSMRRTWQTMSGEQAMGNVDALFGSNSGA
jgi:hypothetical protein